MALTPLGPGSGAALAVVADVLVEVVYGITVASMAPARLAQPPGRGFTHGGASGSAPIGYFNEFTNSFD